MGMKNFDKVIDMLPYEIKEEILKITSEYNSSINEIRMRAGERCSYVLDMAEGSRIKGDHNLSVRDLKECIDRFVEHSYYAHEEELKNGYITLPGGHRAGVCGRSVTEDGHIRLITDISSVTIRHAKEHKGISEDIVKEITKGANFINTLIVSPPGCGKTTFIRDMARSLSNKGYYVGICDERSEIAGMYKGEPSFDLGPNADIMDGCPKAEGMELLLRSMSPDIMITDEIGSKEDIYSIERALISGTGIIATAHGNSMEDIIKSSLAPVIRYGAFEKVVFLTRYPRAGTIRAVNSISGTGR